MGQKVHPIAHRLGFNRDWESHWFSPRLSAQFMREDIIIRDKVKEKFPRMGISQVIIERSDKKIRVTIRTSKPGLLIGRGGAEIEKFKKELLKKIESLRKHYRVSAGTNKSSKIDLKIDIEEVKMPDIDATLVAQDVAEQMERRIPFRRTIKQALRKVMQQRGAKGIKVKVSGRLDGSEMSREEWLAEGKIPLQTLRANIDYGTATSYNSYGTVGVKVWIYKGELFNEKEAVKGSKEKK